LEVLKEYADQLKLKEILFMTPSAGGYVKNTAPAKQVLHYLAIVCSLRDTCVSMVAMRDYVMSLQLQQQAPVISLERLQNYCTPLLAFLLQTSTDLEELLHDKLASVSETSVAASLLPSTMATLLPWRGLVSTLCGRFVNIVLQQIDMHLRAQVQRMQASLPTIAACFSGKTFREDVAKGVLRGTVPATRMAHNQLHQVMCQISDIGHKLGISPALDGHEVTKSAVAIGRAALQEGKDAVVYAEGAEALMLLYTSQGVEKAKACVDKYSKKYIHLEQSFWDQVKELPHYGGVTPDAKGPLKAEEIPGNAGAISSASTSAQSARSSSAGQASASSGSGGGVAAPTLSLATCVAASRQKKGLKRASAMMENA
jgi:hypothetical protein